MSQAFNTILKPSEGLYKEKGSKFLAYAYPIADVEDVKPILESLKADHPSSRHVCYAYQIGVDGEEYRANDDGEPNGSAGLPILNQIKSKEVTNTLVAVVRYFGGTKLGVSGLINAYKEAAKDALDKAKVVEKIPTASITIQFQHSSIGDVERLIRQNNWTIRDQSFELDCVWTVEVSMEEESEANLLLSRIPETKIIGTD